MMYLVNPVLIFGASLPGYLIGYVWGHFKRGFEVGVEHANDYMDG